MPNDDGGTMARRVTKKADAGGNPCFTLGERLAWTRRAAPHRAEPGEPRTRRLHIFAVDPGASRLEGAVAEVSVPYEPLTPGPVGALFRVIDRDDGPKDAGDVRCYTPIDLDDPKLLVTRGVVPSPTDWQSHQQMVYAVAMRVYHAFRRALGRDPSWAFDDCRLALRPHAVQEQNAWYDRDRKEVAFGYFLAKGRRGRPGDRGEVAGPDEWVFTALSHDVVCHELSHALLDGLRTHFLEPTGRDVLGFHEGFSDIIALLHRFEHRELVRSAIVRLRGDLARRSLLSTVARQFGESLGLEGALRNAVDDLAEGFSHPRQYRTDLEEHDLGEVLLSAVFEAFERIYRVKTAPLLRLASNGTGVPAPGDLPHDLIEALTDAAVTLARQFLNICIRAIDYCPPVDIELGEYLRALITADHDLVPEDPFGYREALIASFRRRRVYPTGVPTLSEDALRWRPPRIPECRVPELRFGALRFDGDPGCAASTDELRRQAIALGTFVCHPAHRVAFCLETPGRHSDGADVSPPVVESIRAARRVAPDGSIGFDLVAEVLQRAVVPLRSGTRTPRVTLFGGSTVILGADGEVRYVIGKRLPDTERRERQLDFIRNALHGSHRLWELRGEIYRPAACPLRAVHQARWKPSRMRPNWRWSPQ